MKTPSNARNQSSKHDKGISKLLKIRDEISQNSDKIFDLSNIPKFSSKDINAFTHYLEESNSLQNSLKLIGFSRDFSPDLIYSIFSNVERKQATKDPDIILFLFDCLSFLCSQPKQNQIHLFKIIFTIFNHLHNTQYSQYCRELFKELTQYLFTQSFTLDLSLLNLILQQFTNYSIDPSMSSLLIEIITRCILSNNDELIETSLSVIILLFEDNQNFIEPSLCPELVSILIQYINQFNKNALLILAHSSIKCPKDTTIQDLFCSMPNLIFVYYTQNKKIVFNKDQIIIPSELDDEEISLQDGNFVSPSEDLILSDKQIRDLCGNDLQNLSKLIESFISLSSPQCVEKFIDSTYKMREIIYESPYEIDLLVIDLFILRSLSQKSTVTNLIRMFSNSSIFQKGQTIFSKNGINATLNIIKNSFFNIISDVNPNLLIIFLEMISNNPILFAEHVFRLSYKCGNQFFANTSVLLSLFSGLSIFTQMKITRSMILARNVVLSVLFSLLDDKYIASFIFSDDSLCSSFLNLILEPDLTEIAIERFTKCISKFEFLPEPTTNLISNIFQICATKSSDQQFKNIARKIVKSLISAMSMSVSIVHSITPIFDSTFTFLTTQNVHDNEILDMLLTVCSLITQNRNSIEVNNERYNMILNVLEDVEGNEPSETTLMSLLNQMNASTSIVPGQMFIIQAPAAIPILLAAFSKSKRLIKIISIFYNLATFSVRNVSMCHKGDLAYILLNALKHKFTYKGRVLDFIVDDETTDEILKLLCYVTPIKSSIEIDNSFLSLIMPDENGNFHKKSEKSASSLHRILSSYDPGVFDICTQVPTLEIKNYDGANLNHSFAFCFHAKIDTNYITHFPDCDFIFFRAYDSQGNKLEIFQHLDSFATRYEGNRILTTAPINFSFQSNKWLFFSTFFMKDNEHNKTICYFKVGKQMSDDFLFRQILFDKNVTIEIGLTDKMSIPPDEISPVSMGQFALILPPYQDKMFNQLESNGFSRLNLFESVGFTWNSPIIQKKRKRFDTNMPSLLPTHITPQYFDNLFRYCDEMPSLFLETTLEIFFMAHNYFNSSNDLYPVLYPLQDNLTNKYCQIRINDITLTLSHLFHSKYFGLPSICGIFIKAIEVSTNKAFQYEIIENFVLNINSWYSDNIQNIKKIMRYISNYLIDSSLIKQDDSQFFSEFLIQTYSMNTNPDFLKILEVLLKNQTGFESLFSIMLHLNKEYNNAQIGKEAIEEKIYQYFELLINTWTPQKETKISIPILLSFVQNIGKTRSERILKELITFISSFQNDKYITPLLTIVSINSQYPIPLESPIIICINAIKNNDISNILSIPTPFANWPFWITFCSVLLSSDSLINKMISFLNPNSNFIAEFCTILSYFEIFKSVKLSKTVTTIKNQFILKVLENVTKLQSKVTIPVALYSFFVLFHKLRCSSHSKRILDMCKTYESTGRHHSDIHHILVNNNLSNRLNLESLSLIFPRKIESNQKLVFWASHTISVNINLLLEIKRVLMLPQNEIENLPIADMIVTFIDEYISTSKFPLVSNSLFKNLDSPENLIRSELDNKIKNCWSDIRHFLDSQQSTFDYDNSYKRIVLIEKIRKEKLDSIKNDYKKPHFLLPSSRFIKFPLFFRKSSFSNFEKASVKSIQIKSHQINLKNSCIFCHLIRKSEPFEATLNILNDRFLISFLNKRNKILFSDVKLVSLIRSNCIEIFYEACSSYLLSLEQNDYDFFTTCNDFPFPILINQQDTTNFILRKFSQNQMTIFDFILALNIATGRSFNDYFYYPIFPNVADTSIEYTPINNRNYVSFIKEYFSYDHQTNHTSLTEIHQSNSNNKDLLTSNYQPSSKSTDTDSNHFQNNDSVDSKDSSQNDSHNQHFDISNECRSQNNSEINHNEVTVNQSHNEDSNQFELNDHLNNSITWSEFIQESKQKTNYFPPTFYADYDTFVDKFSDKTVAQMNEIFYTMRRRIESSPKVLDWAKQFFNLKSDVSYSPNCNITNETVKINLTHPIKFSHFFEHSEKYLGVLFETGKIDLVTISDNQIKKTKTIVDSFKEFTDNSTFIVLRDHIAIYDHSNCLLYRFTDSGYETGISFYSNVTHITSIVNKLIFVIDNSRIISYPIETFPNESTLLYTETDGIELITASRNFDVIAFYTYDGVLKIISSFRNHLITEIEIKKKCQDLLITQENAFVVVKTDDEVLTFSLSGRLLARSTCKSTFVKAITAVSSQMVDFVFFIDEQNQLCGFEAYKPHNLLRIASVTSNVSTMKLSRTNNVIYIINKNGELFIIPVCF